MCKYESVLSIVHYRSIKLLKFRSSMHAHISMRRFLLSTESQIRHDVYVMLKRSLSTISLFCNSTGFINGCFMLKILAEKKSKIPLYIFILFYFPLQNELAKVSTEQLVCIFCANKFKFKKCGGIRRKTFCSVHQKKNAVLNNLSEFMAVGTIGHLFFVFTEY